MHKKTLLLIGLFTISINSIACFNDSTKVLSINLGIYLVNSESVTYDVNYNEFTEEIFIPVINFGYEINKNITLNAYLSYSSMGHKVPLVEDSNGMFVLIDSEGIQRLSSNHDNYLLGSKTLFYGIEVNYDLLYLITNRKNLRFSFNICPKVGLVSAKWNELVGADWQENWNGPFLEYGIGFGGGYLFTKKIGIQFNYTIGSFYNNDNSRHYLGLIYKF